MPDPTSVAVHVTLRGSRCEVDEPSRASAGRSVGRAVATFGAELSTVTVAATIGPAGPVRSAASLTWPALRYSRTVPDEQPVKPSVYAVPSAGPAATGELSTQFGAFP